MKREGKRNCKTLFTGIVWLCLYVNIILHHKKILHSSPFKRLIQKGCSQGVHPKKRCKIWPCWHFELGARNFFSGIVLWAFFVDSPGDGLDWIGWGIWKLIDHHRRHRSRCLYVAYFGSHLSSSHLGGGGNRKNPVLHQFRPRVFPIVKKTLHIGEILTANSRPVFYSTKNK